MRKILVLLFVAFVQSSELNQIKWKSIVDKVNSAGSSWTAGYNFDLSISPKSLAPLMGAKVEENLDGPFKTAKDFGTVEVPKEFDARKKWSKCKSIGHIRDQGNCGSCWATAAAEALTDRVCIATKGKKNPSLSVEDILTCCNTCGYGCDGGSPFYAWKYFKRYGVVTGSDYHSQQGCKPYSLQPCEHHMNGSRPQCSSLGETETPSCQLKCTNKKYHLSYRNDKNYKVQDFYVFPRNETEAVKKEIMLHGPVEAIIAVYEDFLAYKSGVYQHLTGDFVGNHAIKIIGWGVEKDLPYWLMVNSWNSDWGEKGYFKWLIGSNACCCQNFAFAGTPRTHKEEAEEENDD